MIESVLEVKIRKARNFIAGLFSVGGALCFLCVFRDTLARFAVVLLKRLTAKFTKI